MAKKRKPALPPVSGAARSAGAERRADAARLMQEQRGKERRRSIAIQVAIGLVVVVAVVATTVAVLAQRDSGGQTAATTPAGLTSDGAVRFGAADAPVTLQAVEDFQCPICQQFESATDVLLQNYREGDQVAVEYRPIAFLDRMSSTDYSTRALNASMCVLEDSGKDVWLTYHADLYAQQPAEGGDGLPDSQLQSMAAAAGADSTDVTSCIDDLTFGEWAKSTTEKFFDDGGSGTPTVFVNGTKLDGFDEATISQAVSAAGGS